MQVALSMIINGLNKESKPKFVCPMLTRIPGIQSISVEITPLLFSFVKGLAPELIVEPVNITVMDKWLNYAAFRNSEIAAVRDMAETDLRFTDHEEGVNYIRNDNNFKVKFYTYLLERHGDVGFDIP